MEDIEVMSEKMAYGVKTTKADKLLLGRRSETRPLAVNPFR